MYSIPAWAYKLRFEIKMLTPEWAAQLKQNQVNQRRLNQSAVRDYTRKIVSGLWRLTYQGIALTTEGKLCDGQHRVEAVLKSGIAIPVVVVYNVPDEIFYNLDQARSRSAADGCHIAGYDRDRLRAGISKIVIQFYQGTVAQVEPCSTPEILRFLDANTEEMEHTLEVASGLSQKATVLGAVHFIFAQINRPAADAFIEAFRTGIVESTNNPAYKLRERLSKQVKNGRFGSRDVLSWAFLAANAWFLNKPLMGLPYPQKDSSETGTMRRFGVHPAVAPSGLRVPNGIDVTPARLAALSNLGNPKQGLVHYNRRDTKQKVTVSVETTINAPVDLFENARA